MPTEGETKASIWTFAGQVPLVVIGLALVVLAALGGLPYGGQVLPIDMGWRYALFAIGLVLSGTGVYWYLRTKVEEPDGNEKQFLFIDWTPLYGRKEKPLKLRYAKLTNVNDLLDKIWISIKPRLPAGTYDDMWVLANVESGHRYNEIGTRWALRRGLQLDLRTLDEVDIRAGMHLEVVPPKQSGP